MAEPVTTGLAWVARWHAWARGDSHSGERYGWLELYAGGHKVADIPMTRWDKRKDAPSAEDVGKAAAQHLAARLQ